MLARETGNSIHPLMGRECISRSDGVQAPLASLPALPRAMNVMAALPLRAVLPARERLEHRVVALTHLHHGTVLVSSRRDRDDVMQGDGAGAVSAYEVEDRAALTRERPPTASVEILPSHRSSLTR